jgi:hypothetical protein
LREWRGREGATTALPLENAFLSFGHGNCSGGAHLDAAFAAQAFLFIDRRGFVILHLKDAHRADIDTFFVTGAFIRVHFHTPSH